tara:strand:+ start:56 stop:202 length:147 start_codon:yes stop_codon:yes gene_type:complete
MSYDRRDKMLEEAQWKEGINAFRLKVTESLAIIDRQIKQLQKEIKELK